MTSAEQLIARQAARRRGEPLISIAGKTAEPYSIGRALLSAGRFERRVSDELRESAGQFVGLPTVPGRGRELIAIPPRAALETGTATAGQELVFTVPGGFAPAYRPMSIAEQLGARIITDVPDNVRLVSVASGQDVEWIDGETLNVDADEQELVFASDAPEPSAGIATTAWSFRIDRQSTPEVERIVEDDFRAALASIYDAALINGSGSNGEPEGLTARGLPGPDLGGGAADWDDITFLELLLANADVPEPYAWAASPALRTELRRTAALGAGTDPIWRGRTILGNPALASTNVPDGTLVLGHWPDAVVVIHAIHVIVDRVTRARQGLVLATLYCVISIGLLRPSFVIAINAAVAAS